MEDRTRSHLPFTWDANPAGLGLLLATLSLLAFGVVMVHSAVASVAEPGVWYARRDVRHTLFALGAVVVLVTAWRFDYRRLVGDRRVPVVLAFLLAAAMACTLLVYVPGLGRAVGGRHRWVRIGPGEYGIGFQPSELVKLSLVVFLAGWLTRKGRDVRSVGKTLLPALMVIGACVAMVVREDFGTAMLIGVAGLVTMFLAGVPWWHLLSLLPAAAGSAWLFVLADPKRWQRIAAMIDPWCTSNPSAYHARQSLLAIMTGGTFGKGLGQGMLKRGYLPEGPTDFIFSVFCEEWGLVGALLLVGLILMWMWHARHAAIGAGDAFGRTLAGSLGFVISFQAVLHVAVDLVAAPPTGIGCPFISAGGTRLLVMAAAASVMLSVTAHRPVGDAVPGPAPAREPTAPVPAAT